MAQLVCPTCGTSYDTSGFTPGQRFRCRGDGCTNKLTVPGGAGGGGDTPTPAGGQAARRPTGQAKKPSGVVKTAAPAAAVPADEDVLEPKVPTTKAKRGDTGRRAKPPSDRVPAAGPAGRGRAVPQAASPAPLYAAIGGVLLIVLIVVIMIFSKGDPAPRPRRDKPPDWRKAAAPVDPSAATTADAGAQPTTDAPPPEPEKPKVRTKKTFRFVEKEGLAARIEAFYDKLMDEDPNVAAEAFDEVAKLGAEAVPVILNKIDTIKYNAMKGRSLGYQLMQLLERHDPEAIDDETLSEHTGVNPRDAGMHSFQDAAKAWREYFRDKKGLPVNDAEVPD